jgi:membrane protein insertase Oxa1/YidC/SpoIIIJ
MPVFIVLYQVLQGLTRTGPDGNFDPKYLSESTSLYQSLSSHDQMDWLGINLAISPADALQIDFATFIPYGLMIIVVLISGYVQQWQIQGRSQNQNQNPQQQMIMKILPAFIGFISFGLQGALVLYFVTSNLFRVGQQFLITHTIYKDDAVTAGVIEADSDEKPVKPKGASGNGAAKSSTGTKGKPTPSRGGSSGNGKGKGQNKRTTSGRGGTASALPQPRARKKKR